MIHYKYEHMFDYIFFLQMLVDLCIAANFHRADPRITLRRQRQAWFGNIRDLKDEMHLEILKNYVCITFRGPLP